MKPSNVYILDEPSNHLDQTCVEALSEAISKWDVKSGALVVVSHDRNFCEKVQFTHVATVQNGKFSLEERSVRDSDWHIDSLFSTSISDKTHSNERKNVDVKKEIDPKLRKLAYNAPKRIQKLEEMIAKAENEISKLEKDMLDFGHDAGKLMPLTKEKESLAAKILKYEVEWEELEEILSKVASIDA
jgi:ABC-type multidrug transport system ATPase subunit